MFIALFLHVFSRNHIKKDRKKKQKTYKSVVVVKERFDCGSEERELQGYVLHFKIYSPNQKSDFGWKCSVNDVMKLSPLRCRDLSRHSGVRAEKKKPSEALLCSLYPPRLSKKQINVNLHILDVA